MATSSNLEKKETEVKIFVPAFHRFLLTFIGIVITIGWLEYATFSSRGVKEPVVEA